MFARDDAAATDNASTRAPRILIVEDDYLIASELEAALADAGYEVAGVANSADEAISIAAAERPLLAVMDIRLSGQRDGIEAAIELFEKHGIRCVFATAYQSPETQMRAQSARPLGWVRKPYAIDSIVQAVRRAVHECQNWQS